MKTLDQLKAKIATLSREELERFALHVVMSLYGEQPEDDDEAEVVLNQDHEWNINTIQEVALDVEAAGLGPKDL